MRRSDVGNVSPYVLITLRYFTLSFVTHSENPTPSFSGFTLRGKREEGTLPLISPSQRSITCMFYHQEVRLRGSLIYLVSGVGRLLPMSLILILYLESS